MLCYKLIAKPGLTKLMFKALGEEIFKDAVLRFKGVALDFSGNRRRGKEHF